MKMKTQTTRKKKSTLFKEKNVKNAANKKTTRKGLNCETAKL